MGTSLDAFCHEIKFDRSFVGDILEFGTCSGSSAKVLNHFFMDSKRIFTFDGFIGLPPTQKVLPKHSGWSVGNCYFEEEEARRVLKPYPNISVIKSMMSDLKHPAAYGISQIAGVNMDLDLYEGTVDALKFVDRCNWKDLLLRFDDWGAHYFQNPEEVAEHEQAAFFEFIKARNYKYAFYDHYNQAEGHMHILVRIQR